MKYLVALFALAVAVSAVPTTYLERDVKINLHDFPNSLNMAAPIRPYLVNLTHDEDYTFPSEGFFQPFTTGKITEFIVIYRVDNATDELEDQYQHGYYIRVEDVSGKGNDFQQGMAPLYKYISKDVEYALLTPDFAKVVVAYDHYYTPLRKLFYDKFYNDVDIDKKIPVFFLMPKKDVISPAFWDTVIIAEVEFLKAGVHKVTEHFGDDAKPSDPDHP